MNVGRNPLQVSSLLPQSAMANLYKWLVSVVLVLVSVSVTQISSEKVAQATGLTCAQGGVCVVGDIGPGGGKVFYVAETPFTSTGSDCDTSCLYLEAAPSDQSTGIIWATTVPFCYSSVGATSTNDCQTNRIYEGSTNVQASSRLAARNIGMGMTNTNQAYARVSSVGGSGGSATSAYAAGLAWAYTNNGKSDWYLPSIGELGQMWDNRVGAALAGIVGTHYWSSSEEGRSAWRLTFNGGVGGTSEKRLGLRVRAIRAFTHGWVDVRGPGGGTVYYYNAAGFACGVNLDQECHFLEFADASRSWDTTGWNSAVRFWSATTNLNVAGTSSALGAGAKNTALIVAGNSTLGYAATDTNNFVSNTGLSDWFLPSYNELTAMCCSSGASFWDVVGSSWQHSANNWWTYRVRPGEVKNLTEKRYSAKVFATRAFSKSDSRLINLSVASETLSPAFDPSVTEYSLTTEQESVRFTPVAVGATFVGVGASSVANGSQSSPIQLNAGSNQVILTVTAADSSSTSYTVNITREISGHVVSFDANGATGSVPSDQIKTIGENLTLTSNSGSLVKTGYTFGGWNTAADGSGTSYAASATYGVDAAVTLYAQWTADSLTVSYNSQSGSEVSAGSTTSGGVVASAPVAPTRTGYVFTGWFAASTGGSAIMFPYTHGRTADFTLFAQWSINTYVVSFDGNGLTGGSAPSNQTKTHGVNLSVALNSGSLVKTGYTFGGWNTHADGSGTSFLEGATYEVDGSLSLLAVWVGDALTVTYDSQSGSAVSAGSSVSGGSITSAPVAPTRAGYVFTGWFTATSGGTAITFPYTHSQTTSFTLYAQWSQASLYGLGSVSKIATITTTTNISNTFSVDTETSSVSLRYLANGLPADSVIDVYLVNDLSRARSLIAPAGGFVVSLVVAWLAPDESVPLMASGKPLSMTIANDTIKAGAKTYAIVGGEVTLLGTATVDGTVTISITQDPEIVVVNPVAVVSQPSATPATPATPASPATESRPSSRPVVAPVTEVRNVPSRVASLLPKVPGATSKIAAILNTVVGQLPPQPMVFAPKLSSNGTVIRVVFKPVVLKAPPVDAPVAPMGAKVIPIGSMIEQSKETPVAPVSKVGAGESKATFGGKTIETALETSLDGAAVLSAGPATIALAGFTSEPASSNGGASTSSGLTASSSTPLEIATGSFIASTPVQVWLFSTPMLLAETSVDENGNFAAAINLPSSLPAGNHTLQIQGFVYTASGAAEVTANIGVSVAAASVGVKWTSTFPLYVASISPSVRALWTTFVSGQASPTLQCTITGIRPQRNSKANIRLFENRQIALTTLLKYNGCVSIETKTQISATKSSVENRTWKVEVQSKATAVAFRWVHDYKTYSSTITTKQKTQWVAKVEKYAGQKLSCAITGADPLRNSSANTVIFNNRNESLKTYLLKNGCSTVQINSPISKNIKIATRTKWKVEVSTSN